MSDGLIYSVVIRPGQARLYPDRCAGCAEGGRREIDLGCNPTSTLAVLASVEALEGRKVSSVTRWLTREAEVASPVPFGKWSQAGLGVRVHNPNPIVVQRLVLEALRQVHGVQVLFSGVGQNTLTV